MQVPIETIIKLYKANLEDKTFSHLEEYFGDFLSFLIRNSSLFQFNKTEGEYLRRVYDDLLKGLFGDFQHMLQKRIDEVQRQLEPQEVNDIAKEAVLQTIAFVDSLPGMSSFDESEYILQNYKADIVKHIEQNYSWVPQDQIELLAIKAVEVFNKNFFREGYVGLAISGFGEDEIFPQMIHVHLSGVINGKVRYIQLESVSITTNMPASITPFAQTDVMQTFLFGINDSLLQKMNEEIPVQIQNCLKGIEDSYFAEGKKEEIEKQLVDTADQILKQVVDQAKKQYLFPITGSVATLPIEELSLLAESMINITSLRRKVAIDSNIGTVGGPIDVAIISKTDGFIWMKRKHYFDREYNPQYFYSHYHVNGGV